MSGAPTSAVILDTGSHDPGLEQALERAGLRVEAVADVDAAVIALHRDGTELLFVDLDSSDEATFEHLERLCLPSDADLIIVGRDPDPAAVARAMRLGAFDYLPKPVESSRLAAVLDELGYSESDDTIPAGAERCVGLVGASPPMRRLFRQLRKVAPTEATVLLVGESGTGKELAAEAVHALSARKAGPFVPVNCGAISRELMESELFGHVKGAFTGASGSHRGFFEQANGGSLFLDEITEMDADLQVKLLRVLESGRMRRVGGEDDIALDVRIVAATNRPPQDAVKQGKLRHDLYYRLAQFPVTLPPLRERTGDVLLLAHHFLARCNADAGAELRFSRAAEDHLRLHSWPGNVRELKHAVERAHILAEREITADDFPSPLTEANVPVGDYVRINVGTPLRQAERRLVMATLKQCGGDKKRAAEALGISRKTLYNRLRSYASETGQDV